MENTTSSLIIRFNTIISNQNFLQTFIHAFTNPFQDSSNEIGIILIIPISIMKELDSLSLGSPKLSFINSNKFINSIIIHSWFLYKKSDKICELHTTDINKQYLKIILSSFEVEFKPDVYIWIKTNQDLCTQFIQLGFKYPYICNVSPLKN